MRNRIIFALVVLGIVGALVSAHFHARPASPQPPAFKPATNPNGEGIFANGIIESYQPQGENINLFPETSGTVARVFVAEGQRVRQGQPLFALDDSVQRAIVAQQQAQAAAALALLGELKAQPRKENLNVARAQVELAQASSKSAQDQLAKLQHAYDLEPKAVSRDVLDNAVNAVKVAKANLEVVTRQHELTKAGAWIFDVQNQEKLYDVALKAAAAAEALLAKYVVHAPVDGAVLSLHTTAGGYVSPQGAYDPYTQGLGPVAIMGPSGSQGYLAVRCYVDEILIPRLPPTERMRARMFIRGSGVSVPMELVRVQPQVSPKIQLSNQRQERVDLRVLPIIFRFVPPPGSRVYPGELVDVYVSDKGPPPLRSLSAAGGQTHAP